MPILRKREQDRRKRLSHHITKPILRKLAAFKQIAAFDECPHLAIGDAALKHPEATIGMDVADALRSKCLRRVLETARNQLRRLDRVVFDIDDTQAESDVRVEIAKGFELIVAAACQV